jgi:hypothetical protein
MKDRVEISKTVTRRQGVSRVRIPPPSLIGKEPAKPLLHELGQRATYGA